MPRQLQLSVMEMRTSLVPVALFVALLFAVDLAPTSAATVRQEVAPKPDVEAHVAQAVDTAAPLSARVAAYQWLLRLKPDERDRSLIQVLSRGDEDFAAMAASQLIRYRFANISQLVNERIPKWSTPGAAQVLDAVKDQKDDPALLDIPRTVLTAYLKGNRNGKQEDDTNAAWLAAIILNRSKSSDDKELVRKLVVQNPHTAGSWLIVLAAAQPDDGELALAISVYRDAKVSLKARVLAAAVAARKDPGAVEYALNEISGFIAHYRDQEIGALATKAYTSQASKTEYLALEHQLLLVCVLRYFDSENARKMTLDALACKNLLIRVAAALAAATRWPAALIHAGQGALSDDEYVKIMAFTSLKHPELTAEIMKTKVDQRAFSRALARLRENGAATVFPIGTILPDD